MFLILAIFSGCHGYLSETCYEFSCENSVLNSTDDKCIFTNSSSFFVSTCEGELHCEVPGSGQEGYCLKTVTSLETLPYPGESCTDSCRYGTCEEETCKGKSKETSCSKTQECDVGLSCRENLCLPLIEEDESGCYNDYDCVNNAGCSKINSDGSGKCIKYFSINKGDEVDTCYGNKNLLCESGSCGLYGKNFVCLSELKNSLESPYVCQTSDYCYSESDSFTGIKLTNKCRCGLNGNAYCGLFNGDPETSDYKTHSRAWIKTQEIHDCHSVRRFSKECIFEMWDSKKHSYLYFEEYIKLYPRVFNAETCLLDVFYGEFVLREENYDESFQVFIWSAVAFWLV
jgi:hypothetical protein